MTTPDILCFGEPLIEFNEQKSGVFHFGFGGDVSNVAIAAARAGGRAGMITHVGDDLFGHRLMELWQAENVDSSNVKVQMDTATGIYFVTHDHKGHRFHYRRAGSAASKFQESDLPLHQIRDCRIFYASGISLAIGNAPRQACLSAMRHARENGILCAFDPNLRTALWSLDEAREHTHSALEYSNIALPSLEDARPLTGQEDPYQILKFYHALGIEIVALTMGRDGVIVSDRDGQTHLKSPEVEAVDATGAGDCFNGTFLARYMKSADAKQAAAMANVAAAQSTLNYGAVKLSVDTT